MWAIKYNNKQNPITVKVFNFDESMPLIRKGEWFRPREPKWQHYFRVQGLEDEQNDVFLVRWHSIQSKNTVGSGFLKFVKSDNPEDIVLVGEKFQENILSRIELWIKNLNQKGKAQGGNDFFSHLNAIPEELFENPAFLKKINNIILSGFDLKIRAKRNGDMREAYKTLKRKALVQLKESIGVDLTEEEFKLLHPRKKNLEGMRFAQEENSIFGADLEDFILPEEDVATAEAQNFNVAKATIDEKTNNKNQKSIDK